MQKSTERQDSPAGEVDAPNADAALLDALVREHREAAVAYATRILGDASLAEDAVQRALLQILLRVRAGDDQLLAVNPRAVVLRGTRWAALKLADRHSSRDEAERRAASEGLVGSADDHDWDRLEARLLVEDILPSLPEHYRDVLRLRYLEGRPDVRAAADLAVTVKAYRRRLDRALVVARGAAVRIGVTSLGAAVLGALRRVRVQVRRVVLASDHAAWSPAGPGSGSFRASVGHIALAVAMIGLVVGSPVVHRGAGASNPPRAGGSQGSAGGSAIAAAGMKATLPPGLSAAIGLGSVPSHRRTAGPLGGSGSDVLADFAGAEVVPAPHAAQNHTVVVGGYGQACACPEFLQTTDGGATWTAYPAPDGAGILLPPDYPRDPRIFLRAWSPYLGGGVCVVPRIAAGTCTPDLRVPYYGYGSLALDPAFDAGHPIMYVSTPAGVVAFNDVTGRTTPLEVNSSSDGNGLPMVPASGSGSYGVYLLVSGTPVARGTTVTRERASAAVPWVGSKHLVGCRRDGSCVTLADLPGDVQQIYGDRDDPSGRTVVAVGVGRLVLTTDAGATQHVVPLASASEGVIRLEAIGSGAQLQITAEMASAEMQHWQLAIWQPATGWVVRSMDPIVPTVSMASDAALGSGRVIVDALGGPMGNIHCSTDNGLRWSRLCPPAA